MDSSYDLYSRPERKLKTRTLRSGRENAAQCEPEGERVLDVGADLDFLNSKSWGELLSSKSPGGFSCASDGDQYSTDPLESAEMA